ncbi:BQ2448_5303 [Microbotryum intermedium]|uniref:BQ2448_5303 protein n=1 Tax=Microbotryum intermedium TaxID=269621 RepID=A0A238F0M1_9BASI|nr:BQ2448_5303 [Microbotryum intermedium]
MSNSIPHRSAVVLGAVACLFAYGSSRIVVSPWTLVICSPLILISTALFFVVLDLWATWSSELRILNRLAEAHRQGPYGLRAAARGATWNAGSTIDTTTDKSGDRIHTSSSYHRRPVAPLVFTSPAAWLVLQTRASFESPTSTARPPFPGATPELAASLDELLNLIMRDFVLRWYASISDSPSFPQAVEQTIREALLAIASRVGAVDWSDVVVGKILPLFSAHLECFRAAEHALRGQDVHAQLTESDELDLFLASRYARGTKAGKLHPAVNIASPNSKPAEGSWLSGLIGNILPFIIPERELDSGAVRIMCREIVASSVLGPIVDLLSDPDFWNRLIEEKAGAAIRDQKMVNQFREALDKQGITLSPTALSPRTPSLRQNRKTEEISARTNPKQFDAWSKSIAQCANLLDARRLRSDVTNHIRRTTATIASKSADELVDGVKVLELGNFVDRLDAVKRKIDKRIVELGGLNPSQEPLSVAAMVKSLTVPSPSVTLRDILLQPTALSYFMEYQERRKRSIRVQFWLLVEGLKDPLEGTGVDEETALMRPPSPSTIATARDDILMVWSTYLVHNSLNSDQKHLQVIKTFAERDSSAPVTAAELRRVRHAIFAAQRDVLAEMEEEDFPPFAKSTLYFKAIADLSNSSPSVPTDSVARVPPEQPRPLARPRALSNPQTPLARQFTPPEVQRSNSPPTLPARRPPPPALPPRRSSSPPPTILTSKPELVHRTDTAPPQITRQVAVDSRPSGRRVGSDNGIFGDGGSFSRKASIDSLASYDGNMTHSGGRRRPPVNLSDSLEFLMASPAVGADEGRRSPLFDDEGDVDHSPLSLKRTPAEGGPTLTDDEAVQVHTIEAIQEALTSILATDARSSGAGSTSSMPPNARPGITPHEEGLRTRHQRSSSEMVQSQHQRKPSQLPSSNLDRSDRIPSKSSSKSGPLHIATSPEEPSIRSKRVFDDEEDVDGLNLDEAEETEFDVRALRLAAPGDLQLSDEIERLGAQLDKLRSQELVVEALIRKAELTGIASELKILTKSRDSLRREIRALTFQKSQFESQESENKLVPDRTTVTISGTTIGQAEGQSFQLYLVEVHQLAQDGAFGSGWIVTRRYSEFATLHAHLREKYVAARNLEFPGKRLVTSYNDGFIEQRKLGLEKYLQALIRVPVICQSNELRSFLSQQNISLPKFDVDSTKRLTVSLFPGQGLVRSFYRTVTSGIDDMLGAGSASMMDTIIQRLSQQAADMAGIGGSGVQDEDLVGQLIGDATKDPSRFSSLAMGLGEEGLTYFTAPICDLFVVLFQLKEKNNWLRRQAILIILQQILGGTIERKFRDGVKMLFGSQQLVSYISNLEGAMWPGGELKPKEPPRTTAQKMATRDSANCKLSALMPDIAANLIGRANARQGARRLFAVLQNRRLNRHLIYSIIDEAILVLFPELANLPPRPLPTFSAQSRSRA